MATAKQSDVFRAKLSAQVNRSAVYDDYNRLTDSGTDRQLGSIEITADSLEALKKKLHAHIDLLE